MEMSTKAEGRLSYMNGDAGIQQYVYRVFSNILIFLFDPKVNPYGITIICDYENASEHCSSQYGAEPLGLTYKTSDSTSTITLCGPFFKDVKAARSCDDPQIVANRHMEDQGG